MARVSEIGSPIDAAAAGSGNLLAAARCLQIVVALVVAEPVEVVATVEQELSLHDGVLGALGQLLGKLIEVARIKKMEVVLEGLPEQE